MAGLLEKLKGFGRKAKDVAMYDVGDAAGRAKDATVSKSTDVYEKLGEKVGREMEGAKRVGAAYRSDSWGATPREMSAAWREHKGAMAKTGIVAAGAGAAIGTTAGLGWRAGKGIVKAPFKAGEMFERGMDYINPRLFVPYLIFAVMIHLLDWSMRFPRRDILSFYTDQMFAFHIAFAVLFWVIFFRQRNATLQQNFSILGGLIVVAVIAYIFPLIGTFMPSFLMIQPVVIALNPIIHPIWVYFGLITFKESKWAGRLLTLVVMFWTLFIIFQFMAQGTQFGRATINPGDYQNMIELGQEWLKGAKNFGGIIWTGIIGGVSQAYNQTIYMATGGDFYYTGQVDRNAKAKLGVYIEDLKEAAPEFYDDEPVTIWATMKAQTLDEPIRINMQCYKYDPSEKKANLREQIPREKGKLTPREDFYVAELEEEDVECYFDRIPKGRQVVGFKADFDFQTQAYYRTYFMDINRLRSYRIEDIDILREYGITERVPTAIYTNGPINIGMRVKEPPIGIGTYEVQGGEQYTVDKLSLRITIDNAWEGKVININRMVLMLPKGMTLDYDAEGRYYCNEFQFDQASCSNVGIGERCDESLNNIYMMRINNTQEAQQTEETITGDETEGTAETATEVKPRQEINIEKYRAISCTILLENTEEILSQNPITARYFKVLLDYEYSIEKELALSIQSSGTEAEIGAEKETAKIYFNGNISDEEYLARKVAVGTRAQNVEKNLTPLILEKAKEHNLNIYLIKAMLMESSWNKDKVSDDGRHFGIMQISEQSLSEAGITCGEEYKTNDTSGITCGTQLLGAVVNKIKEQNIPLTQKAVIAGYYGGINVLQQSTLCEGKRKFECEDDLYYQTNLYYINEVSRLYMSFT